MPQMSVHRALTRLKTLDAQILKAAQQGVYVAMAKGDKKLVTTSTVRTLTAEAVEVRVKADYQSVTDLIAERAKLKSKVVASNAATMIEVAGVKMTVAEAIERKDNSIKYEQALLQTLRAQLGRVSAEFAQQQGVLEREISEKQASLAGRETNTKMNAEEMNGLTNMIAQREQPIMLDPIGLDAEIQKLDKAIVSFLEEVDSALNESNAVTKIDV